MSADDKRPRRLGVVDGGKAARGDDTTSERRPSTADELVRLVERGYRVGLSESGEPFAVPRDGPQIPRMLRGGRGSLRAAVAAEYFAGTGRAASASALADALLVVEGRAAQCSPEPLALRVAEADTAAGRTLLLDLGDETGRAIAITASGWAVIDTAPVLFRRTGLTTALPEPERGGSLDGLRRLLNVRDESWPLIAAWQVAALVPGLSHPVLSLVGEAGAAKTTATRIVAGTIDPSPVPTRSTPRDIDAWATAAAGSWVVPLDNVSRLGADMSDAICRAVTGDGAVRRRLYSDGDLYVIAFRRAVVMNGVGLATLRGDLADRLVLVELDRIIGHKAELDIAAEWQAMHPRALAGLLDLACAVLAVLPDVRPGKLPRMADYARILAAVDHVLGTDGLAHYRQQAGRLAEEVAESDPVVSALRAIVTGRWSGTAGDLLSLLTPERPSKGWPTTARGLSATLTRAAPALRRLGYGVEHERQAGTGRRLWEITPPPPGPPSDDDTTRTTELVAPEPSQPSQPSRQAADLRKRRDGRCDGRVPVAPTVTPTVTPAQAADLRKRADRDGCDGVTVGNGLSSDAAHDADRVDGVTPPLDPGWTAATPASCTRCGAPTFRYGAADTKPICGKCAMAGAS